MRKAIQQLEEEIELLKNQIEELKEDLQNEKDNYKSLEWHNNNQYKLLTKYKKFVDILKNNLGISFYNYKVNNEDIYEIMINGVLKGYTQEEYNLLKEVFDDE